jgi:hypothetical protein
VQCEGRPRRDRLRSCIDNRERGGQIRPPASPLPPLAPRLTPPPPVLWLTPPSPGAARLIVVWAPPQRNPSPGAPADTPLARKRLRLCRRPRRCFSRPPDTPCSIQLPVHCRSDDIFPRIDEGMEGMEGMMKIDVVRVARRCRRAKIVVGDIERDRLVRHDPDDRVDIDVRDDDKGTTTSSSRHMVGCRVASDSPPSTWAIWPGCARPVVARTTTRSR